MAPPKTLLTSLAHRLVQDGLLTETEAVNAMAQSVATQTPFISYLVKQKLIQPASLATAIAQDFGLPLLDLHTFDIKLIPTKLVNEKLIQRHHVLPLLQKNKQLYLAVADPTNQIALDEIKFHTGLNPKCIVVEENKLSEYIEWVLNIRELILLGDLSDAILDEIAITTVEGEAVPKVSATEAEDAPIVRYVHKILLDALNKSASDIHFEPYEKDYRIRFRIDGILYEIAKPPVALAGRIAARVKIMAQLDISERRVPQDGRFKMTLSKKRTTDFRISTCPTINGEKIVVRILDPSTAILNVDTLGFVPAQKELFLKTIEKPQGMILVTGPTGSGKTITLYTALNILNTPEVNISTVEDPVEIYLPGINQVNINLKAGLTFATALRAFLRQDPDIIMVGEMRDLETAEIGIKAAQTGHLVLSTLHTNNASETLTRLTNMGVATYNIAASTSLIIAQRLTRRLCNHCKIEVKIPHEALLQEGFLEEDLKELKIYGPTLAGCDNCTNGYKGRVGIFEMLPVTKEIEQLIMRSGSGINALDIARTAQSEGMRNLRQSGLNKVKEGVTSLAEINRVIID